MNKGVISTDDGNVRDRMLEFGEQVFEFLGYICVVNFIVFAGCCIIVFWKGSGGNVH